MKYEIKSATASKILGITRQCLSLWRRRGFGPSWVQISPRIIRYRRDEVEAWAEGRRA